MRTPPTQLFRFVASLACTAGLLAAGASSSTVSQDPETPVQVPRVSPALLPAQDGGSVRVTPVVKAVRRAANSVVSIYLVDRRRKSADGQGSGVILDESGLVISNWHVVFRAADSNYQLQVRLKDNRQLPARVLSTSPEHDLALLQIELPAGETVQPMALGDSSTLMIGETVIAIGNPQGHANTVTVGVLSAQDRSIKVRAPDGQVRSFSGLLQTDAAINQGNSGGALLDITGKLIGINNAMAVSAENIGFAIPVDAVKQVFEDVLLASDNLADVWLGLSVVDGTDGHVIVDEIDPVGPAARAGVQKGDRILSALGKAVATRVDYARRVLEAKAGQKFVLRLQRRGRKIAATPIPLSRASAELVQRIGIEVEWVSRRDDSSLIRTASLAYYSNRRRARLLPGVARIVRVHQDSPASDVSLRKGDILLGYGRTNWWGDYEEIPYRSAQDVADTVRMYANRDLPIIVLRDGRMFDGTLRVRR